MNHKDKVKAYEMFIKLYLSEEKGLMIKKEYERLRHLKYVCLVSEKYAKDCACYHQAFLNCKFYRELRLFNQIINKERN